MNSKKMETSEKIEKLIKLEKIRSKLKNSQIIKSFGKKFKKIKGKKHFPRKKKHFQENRKKFPRAVFQKIAKY